MVSVAIARTDDGRAAGAFLRHMPLMPHQHRTLQGPGHVPLLWKFLQQGGRQRRVPETKRVRGPPQTTPTSGQHETPSWIHGPQFKKHYVKHMSYEVQLQRSLAIKGSVPDSNLILPGNGRGVCDLHLTLCKWSDG
ncbi:hypothetical protein TNCV_410911 [Trichonephila clavipes]|nr:hypothetical protein TNCV_410911 [Trichonephila clavipes]